MGGAPAGARVQRREELFRNGSARGAVDGEVGCHCGSPGSAERSGENESWRISRMDR